MLLKSKVNSLNYVWSYKEGRSPFRAAGAGRRPHTAGWQGGESPIITLPGGRGVHSTVKSCWPGAKTLFAMRATFAVD